MAYEFSPLSFPFLNGVPMQFDDSMSDIKLLGACVKKINEVGENVAGFLAMLAEKEDALSLSKNRKLSLLGNFTGKWNGRTLDEVLLDINENNALYTTILNALTTGAPLEQIVDGGMFSDTENETIEIGGIF